MIVKKIFVVLVILIAVVVGILALTLPRDQVVQLVVFREFFDVSLPILAFGALIKYLVTCKKKKCCCCYKGGASCNCGQKGCPVCEKKM